MHDHLQQISRRVLLASTLSIPFAAPGMVCAEPAGQYFNDVPDALQFSTEVNGLAASGVVQGWPDRTYRPLAPVARDAMAAFIFRCAKPLHLDSTPPTVSPFVDIKPTDAFYKEICWLHKKGIARGWPDGTFRPLEPVRRDAMAAFLRRACHDRYSVSDSPYFNDVKQDDMFFTDIQWMQERGISTGWPDGSYRPLEIVRRDAMAAFLSRVGNQLLDDAWSQPKGVPMDDPRTPAVKIKLIDLINDERASVGLDRLTLDPDLEVVADETAKTAKINTYHNGDSTADQWWANFPPSVHTDVVVTDLVDPLLSAEEVAQAIFDSFHNPRGYPVSPDWLHSEYFDEPMTRIGIGISARWFSMEWSNQVACLALAPRS